jgi:hypothetical protein
MVTSLLFVKTESIISKTPIFSMSSLNVVIKIGSCFIPQIETPILYERYKEGSCVPLL